MATKYPSVHLIIILLRVFGMVTSIGSGGTMAWFASPFFKAHTDDPLASLAIAATFLVVAAWTFLPFGLAADSYRMLRDIADSVAESTLLLRRMEGRPNARDVDALASLNLQSQE